MFKDKYKGRDFLVLSCGPSLNNYTERDIREFSSDKIVVCIKLAFHKYHDICNVLLANCCNLPIPKNGVFYDFNEYKRPDLVIFSSNFSRGTRLGYKQDMDLFLKVENLPAGSKDFVAFKHDFDNLTFDKVPRRCYPGIMGEVCIPLIDWLGGKRLYTLGWDLSRDYMSSSSYKHSWDETQKLYIPGHILPWDCKANVEASSGLYHWLKNRGVDWHILGNSALSEDIPRARIS